MGDNCANCRPFWAVDPVSEDTGVCRRFPPTVVWGMNVMGDRQPLSLWPKTHASDWCGEHRSSPPAKVGGGLPPKAKGRRK